MNCWKDDKRGIRVFLVLLTLIVLTLMVGQSTAADAVVTFDEDSQKQNALRLDTFFTGAPSDVKYGY